MALAAVKIRFRDPPMSTKSDQSRAGVPVSAVLLYRSHDAAVATTFLHALNDAVKDLGEVFEFADEQGADSFVFHGRDHTIVVSENEGALPRGILDGALAHPFIDAVFPAGRAIALGHAAHANVTVLGGQADANVEPNPETLDNEDFEPKAMLPRLRLLRAAANALAKQRFPLAVHWVPCDQLMAGPDFVQLAERGAETELFVKAVPYSTQAQDCTAYGAVTNGAASVIGREVELVEAPVEASWAANTLLQFVEKARSGVPAAGQALRFPSDEIVLVHEEPASEMAPAGHLRLTVEKLPGSSEAVGDHADAGMGFLNDMDKRVAARGFGRR